MKTTHILAAGVSAALMMAASATAQTIAQWTFETSIPTTSGPLSPELGLGTATSNTGGTFTNPAGWGSVESWGSDNWTIGEYFEFQVSTTGFESISLSWQQTGSNTGPANFNLSYSTDGVSFTSIGNYTVTNDGWNTTATPAASVKSFDLSSISAINNTASVYFRLSVVDAVSIAGGTVANGGTSRIDNFTVAVVPEPSTVALIGIGCGVLLFGMRRKRA